MRKRGGGGERGEKEDSHSIILERAREKERARERDRKRERESKNGASDQ